MKKLVTKKFWLESKFLQISFWQRMASQLNLLLSKIVKNDLQKDLTVTKLRLWSFKLHTLFIHLFLPYHLSLGVVQWLRGPNFAPFWLPPTYLYWTNVDNSKFPPPISILQIFVIWRRKYLLQNNLFQFMLKY